MTNSPARPARREIVQVAFQRDRRRAHFARRQAGGQPFARVGIDREWQVAVDGRHGATDHHAAQVGAAGGGLALGAPLALQARVQVLVADPQLGDVDEPVARIRALDLRVHVQLAHLDGRLLEDVGQRELEPFGAALERGVGRAGLRARARLSVWMKSPGSPCTRNCAYSPRSAGPSGRAAQDRPRTARSEVSSVNLPWSSCSQARPLRRPATGSAGSQADQASGSRSSACR